MASPGSVLPNGDRDEPTLVLRVNSAPHLAVTLDGLPPRLPTLSGFLELPLGLPIASIQVTGYDILRELGRGGMGVVYLARQRKLNRYVALKMVLARQYAGPEDQQRFRQEVESVAKLNHPNIAQVYEVGEHDGFAFAAFEYVDGGTLLQWQKEQPLPPQVAARLLAVIARAVQHAHDHGIIHRDLKPANILLQEARTDALTSKTGLVSSLAANAMIPVPKVTDFGLAKKLDEHSDLTATGMACGTPNYMAPEQIRGKQAHIGPGTDVYGLGAILFEMLTAKPPFRGETPLVTMQAVMRDPPPPVRKLRAEVPHDLDVIVAKCLEKDPNRRYGSAAELADDLERFLDYRPIHARGIGRIERAGRWVRRNPLAAGLTATFAIGFVGMFIFASVLWNRVRTEQELRGRLETAIVESDDARSLADRNLQLAKSRQKDAETAKAAAEVAGRNAEAALKASEASAARAREMLNLATQSIDTVLARFATDPRFQDEDFLQVRQDLLRNATQLYAQLKRQTSDAALLEYRSLRAQYFLGLLARASGKIDEGNREVYLAIDRFNELMRKKPMAADWHVELAGMHLDSIDRALQDGSLYRVNVSSHMTEARKAIEAAGKVPEAFDAKGRAAFDLVQAKLKVQQAFVTGFLLPKEQGALAEAAEPFVDAVFKAQPREPEAVDLYGKLLLIQAQVLARSGSTLADCYYEAAEDHYRAAFTNWFPSRRMTRWHCRFALARQAHAIYLDSIGLVDRSDEAFSHTRSLLENAIDNAPEISHYRMDLAEAYLGIIKRTRRLDPKWDPQPMVRILDSRLAPFWNLGVPTDRARRVLAESKTVAADWFRENGRFIDAGNSHLDAADVWMHGFKGDEGGFYRENCSLSLSRAAYQFAIANQEEWVYRCEESLEKVNSMPPGASYNMARAWCILAIANPEKREENLQNALVALRAADAAGFFRFPGMFQHFQQAPELEPIRDRFKPANLPKAKKES